MRNRALVLAKILAESDEAMRKDVFDMFCQIENASPNMAFKVCA